MLLSNYPEETDRDRRRREARERDARSAALRPLKQELEKTEATIAALETEKSQLEPQLADPALYNDFQRARPLTTRFQEIQSQLEQLYARWEELQGELERV